MAGERPRDRPGSSGPSERSQRGVAAPAGTRSLLSTAVAVVTQSTAHPTSAQLAHGSGGGPPTPITGMSTSKTYAPRTSTTNRDQPDHTPARTTAIPPSTRPTPITIGAIAK